jgi:hypothetical protein
MAMGLYLQAACKLWFQVRRRMKCAPIGKYHKTIAGFLSYAIALQGLPLRLQRVVAFLRP